ncbi:hypothetical protein [Rhizobium alvei]|uniref:Uncharacterized protein n=1 Tax=Rhizobium alvei TaxID=1132659 RepID=A0ABT8YK58_9HYPH|nr:hypothetical protein [Rhizobium alvei]MDO6964001.1 hypothetical protein [Rhizobium alvei]
MVEQLFFRPLGAGFVKLGFPRGYQIPDVGPLFHFFNASPVKELVDLVR